jgi:para-nitrobenzyl esterase
MATTETNTNTNTDTGARAQHFVEVETTYGRLRGRDVDGIKVFKGVQYGGSTAGKNRFMPPTKPTPWTGVRDALEFGEVAPQPTGDTSEYGRLIGWDNHPGRMGEDCLVMNVWTPGLDNKKRAVMLSIHGGGFTSGSGSTPGYAGKQLARFGDVVVITVNHRLGALGYLHLGDLGGPEYAQSGTVGMLDLVAALQWVRDNIERFGGDPNTVMVWGQSGGGAKTSTLMAMPSAKGLFRRAAVQSGSALLLMTREVGTGMAERLLAKLELDKSKIAQLQAMPFEQLIAAQRALAPDGPRLGFAPVVDGNAIPRHPFDPTAPEITADVPLIVGTTLDDAAMGGRFDIDDAGIKARLEKSKRNGAHADRILNLYRKHYPDASSFLLQARMLTDRGGRRSATTMAERKAALGKAPAYLYVFTWPSPALGGKFGAVHGVDVGLAFNNARGAMAGDTPEARALAGRFAAAWVAFAKTGDPNTKEIPHWPAYDAKTRPTMIFDNEVRLENDPLRELRMLWDELRG